MIMKAYIDKATLSLEMGERKLQNSIYFIKFHNFPWSLREPQRQPMRGLNLVSHGHVFLRHRVLRQDYRRHAVSQKIRYFRRQPSSEIIENRYRFSAIRRQYTVQNT